MEEFYFIWEFQLLCFPPVMLRMWKQRCGHISCKGNNILAEEVCFMTAHPLTRAVITNLICIHYCLTDCGALGKGGALETTKAWSIFDKTLVVYNKIQRMKEYWVCQRPDYSETKLIIVKVVLNSKQSKTNKTKKVSFPLLNHSPFKSNQSPSKCDTVDPSLPDALVIQ